MLGGYRVRADGTLGGALETFGEPSRMRRDPTSGWNGCVVTWRSAGLRIYFYNLGGQDSCEPESGRFRDALVTGKQWRTASGLRIGHAERLIRRYHPRAQKRQGGWWSLVTRRSPYGEGGPYDGLAAKVNRGSVSAFAIYFQAGGD